MQFILESPTKLRILDPSEPELKGLQKYLSYKNSSVAYQIKNLKKNFYLAQRYGTDYVNRKIKELEEQLVSTLLHTDGKGFYTLSGVADDLRQRFSTPILNQIEYPDFKDLPWHIAPTLTPYDYQNATVEHFVNNPHSHAELATGLGKSYIVTLLLKRVGLPTVIVTPSASIARQIYDDTLKAFGKKYVGLYGDGKKEVGKHFLICIGKSLANVEHKDLIEEFKKYQVFISDESHTLGADLFADFSLKLLGHCPYRWFLSATQERNDGTDLLLQGIIGKKVYEKTIQDGIKEGYLAKLSTLIFDVESASKYTGSNVLKANQEHLYKNIAVVRLVANCAAQAVNSGKPTLILIDEYEQEKLLKAHMNVPYTFAHGGDKDIHQIVKDFNDGKIMCVVGTSAVSTGTNFKPLQCTINFKANKAGTKVKQGAIGRSTRLDPASGKKDCKIIDFRITNVPLLKRHADMRIGYYQDVGEVTFLEIASVKQPRLS